MQRQRGLEPPDAILRIRCAPLGGSKSGVDLVAGTSFASSLNRRRDLGSSTSPARPPRMQLLSFFYHLHHTYDAHVLLTRARDKDFLPLVVVDRHLGTT